MTYQHYLEQLQTFPNRANGHVNERKAADMLLGMYRDMGYAPQEQKFKILKHSWIAYFMDFFFYFAAGVSIAFGQLIPAIILTFLGICSFFGVPFNLTLLYQKLFEADSQNIYAKLEPTKEHKNTLVILGHYDTGKVIVGAKVFGKIYNLIAHKGINGNGEGFSIKLPKFFQTPAFIANTVLICLVLSMILRLTIDKYYLVLLITAIFWSFAHLVFITHVLISPFVPGALDNGSGASIVLALADYFKDKPMQYTELIFLNTGAEENRSACNGAANFVKSDIVNKENTYYINLECLGEKHLIATTGESDNHGSIHNSDENALKFIQKFTKNSEFSNKIKFTYLPIASDASSIERNGGKMMTTLVGMSNKGASDIYHTMGDTIERINFDSMDIAFRYLCAIIKEYDQTP